MFKMGKVEIEGESHKALLVDSDAKEPRSYVRFICNVG